MIFLLAWCGKNRPGGGSGSRSPPRKYCMSGCMRCINHVRAITRFTSRQSRYRESGHIVPWSRRDHWKQNRMWLVTGPFDGEVSNEVGFQSNAFSSFTTHQSNPRYVPESKLLKSGKSYIIGRKLTCDLVVNHKKV